MIQEFIKSLSLDIFQALRGMDEEASSIVDGYPTGLNWYGGYVGKKKGTEFAWCRRLKEYLKEQSWRVREKEEHYPVNPSNRCDLVVDLPDNKPFWIEIKGAWKEWGRQKKSYENIYKSHLGLDNKKENNAAHDLVRLNTLQLRDASAVGLLLIGFDSEMVTMNDDIVKFKSLSVLESEQWKLEYDEWKDQHRRESRCQVRCWLWWKTIV